MADLTRIEARIDLTRGVNTHECICEMLRMAYDQVYLLPDSPEKERLEEILVDCFVMGKKMQNRLIQYAKNHPDDSGSRGQHLKIMPGAPQKLAARQARPL